MLKFIIRRAPPGNVVIHEIAIVFYKQVNIPGFANKGFEMSFLGFSNKGLFFQDLLIRVN